MSASPLTSAESCRCQISASVCALCGHASVRTHTLRRCREAGMARARLNPALPASAPRPRVHPARHSPKLHPTSFATSAGCLRCPLCWPSVVVGTLLCLPVVALLQAPDRLRCERRHCSQHLCHPELSETKHTRRTLDDESRTCQPFATMVCQACCRLRAIAPIVATSLLVRPEYIRRQPRSECAKALYTVSEKGSQDCATQAGDRREGHMRVL